MSARVPQPQIRSAPDPGPVLVLAAHPGDELVGCGGALALHAAQGDAPRVIVAYDGAAAAPSARREELAARRRAECVSGGRHLGGLEYEFLDYPEGREPTPEELFFAARLLAGRIDELRPATLYAPWPGEQRHDQHTLARAVELALEMCTARPSVWGCEVWTPLVAARVLDIGAVQARKEAALREHRPLAGQRDLAHVALGLSAQRSNWLPAPARWAEAFAPWPAALALRHGRPGHAA